MSLRISPFSTPQISIMLKGSTPLSTNWDQLSIKHGQNMLKDQKCRNIQNNGGLTHVALLWTTIKCLGVVIPRRLSSQLPEKPKGRSSIAKSKKLRTRAEVLGSLWTGSRKESSQQPKQLSIIAHLASPLIVCGLPLSQIRYLLVVILGLNSVSGVQYKSVMTDRWWKVSTEIIDVVKSEV